MDLMHETEIKDEPVERMEYGGTNEKVYVISGLENIKDKSCDPGIDIKSEIEIHEESELENFQAESLDPNADIKNEINIKEEPLDFCNEDENIQISKVNENRKRKRGNQEEKLETPKEKKSSGSRRKELKKDDKTIAKKINLLWLHENIKCELDACKFLQDSRIIQETVLCKNNHPMKLVLCDLIPNWRCSVENCRLIVSIRNDTWFHGSTLSLKKIIVFIYCWSENLISTRFCLEELNLNHTTAVDLTGYLHEVCAHALINDKYPPIGGENNVVEVDEVRFKEQKWNRDRLLFGQWIYGGICRETKEFFMFSVPDTEKKEETLLECIKSTVKPGTTIISDCWSSYKSIEKIEGFNYKHFNVNRFLESKSKPYFHAESTWKVLKYKNKEHYEADRHLLDSFICEFLWRKRNSNNDLFKIILNNIANFR